MQWVSRSNHMGSIPVRVTMKRLPTPLGVGSLFISGLPVRESPGCPRCQSPTVISSKSLLPLQCPVSLPGGNRCKDPSPPCQRGVVLPLAKPGGFRRLAGFPMSLYFLKSADCESPQSKIKDFCQLPLAREPFGGCIDTGRGRAVTISDQLGAH